MVDADGGWEVVWEGVVDADSDGDWEVVWEAAPTTSFVILHLYGPRLMPVILPFLSVLTHMSPMPYFTHLSQGCLSSQPLQALAQFVHY